VTASSAKEAKAMGLKHYFTGRPCKAGHVDMRYASTKQCASCLRVWDKAWKAGNPEKCAEMRRNWAAANPERNKAIKSAWSKANPEGQAKRSREWFLKNRDKANAATAAWVKRNPANALAWATKRRMAVMNRVPPWADKSIITSLYKLAKIYRQFGHDVHVDHIIPVRGRLVSGLHVHENLQLISGSENRSKSNTFQGA
jgi:hypothetical protein